MRVPLPSGIRAAGNKFLRIFLIGSTSLSIYHIYICHSAWCQTYGQLSFS